MSVRLCGTLDVFFCSSLGSDGALSHVAALSPHTIGISQPASVAEYAI